MLYKKIPEGWFIKLGNLAYRSPEQVRGEIPTPASDLYLLGVVAYRTLSGYLPFEAVNEFEKLKMMLSQSVPPELDKRNSTIPKSVSKAVMGALYKDSRNRYLSAGDFARKFGQAINHSHPSWLSKIFNT